MGWLALIVGALGTYELLTWTESVGERRALYAVAEAAAREAGKPLLVVGIPKGRHGRGDAVIDLVSDGHPDTFVLDITDLSAIPDKLFGACFVSHVLEHIPQINKAMLNLRRVSENVFVAFPRKETFIAWLHPDHRHIIKSAPPYGAFEHRKILGR